MAIADYGLVVWSNASIESQDVPSEAERIKKRGRYVPVRIDEAEVPLGFDTIQNFDVRGWTGNSDNKEWTRLLELLDQTAQQSERAATVFADRLHDRNGLRPVVEPAPFPPINCVTVRSASAQSQSHDSAYPRGDRPESSIEPMGSEPSV